MKPEEIDKLLNEPIGDEDIDALLVDDADIDALLGDDIELDSDDEEIDALLGGIDESYLSEDEQILLANKDFMESKSPTELDAHMMKLQEELMTNVEGILESYSSGSLAGEHFGSDADYDELDILEEELNALGGDEEECLIHMNGSCNCVEGSASRTNPLRRYKNRQEAFIATKKRYLKLVKKLQKSCNKFRRLKPAHHANVTAVVSAPASVAVSPFKTMASMHVSSFGALVRNIEEVLDDSKERRIERRAKRLERREERKEDRRKAKIMRAAEACDSKYQQLVRVWKKLNRLGDTSGLLSPEKVVGMGAGHLKKAVKQSKRKVSRKQKSQLRRSMAMSRARIQRLRREKQEESQEKLIRSRKAIKARREERKERREDRREIRKERRQDRRTRRKDRRQDRMERIKARRLERLEKRRQMLAKPAPSPVRKPLPMVRKPLPMPSKVVPDDYSNMATTQYIDAADIAALKRAESAMKAKSSPSLIQKVEKVEEKAVKQTGAFAKSLEKQIKKLTADLDRSRKAHRNALDKKQKADKAGKKDESKKHYEVVRAEAQKITQLNTQIKRKQERLSKVQK